MLLLNIESHSTWINILCGGLVIIIAGILTGKFLSKEPKTHIQENNEHLLKVYKNLQSSRHRIKSVKAHLLAMKFTNNTEMYQRILQIEINIENEIENLEQSTDFELMQLNMK